MNFLQIWFGSDIPDLAYKSKESIESVMLKGDSYTMITDIKECDRFMTSWFFKAIPFYENQGYKKWAFSSVMLRLNYAALDNDLCYADTDTIFYNRPEPVKDIKVPLAYGDGHLSVFYVNNQADWFEVLLRKIESDIPMSPAWTSALENLPRLGKLPEKVCKHNFLRGDYSDKT